MSNVIETRGLTRRYGSTVALHPTDLTFEKDTIHGLLGRNGAGKTTLMSIITAQEWPSEGEVRVFGQVPHENEQVLPKICFVREDQKYPDDARAHHAFNAASQAFANWDWELCHRLCEDFAVPKKTKVKKMSRGQRSAVAVIIGIASRAEVTFFDEPYMGLDAVARKVFYDRLLEDYAEHPRTIVLSSHLIDEIAHLIENVVLIDKGRIVLDEPAESLRERAVTLVGRADAVQEIAAGREVLAHESLGRMVRTTVMGALTDDERQRLRELDLDVVPVSLQQLVVHLTTQTTDQTAEEAAR
ncbi:MULTISPECIES: ATP-binding cassette domain-containing protein [Auritidibacter]|uniref:ATP-binding cassette domain-containing protein n=1 Tax=Auritidibacter TaxID=1160973 RepID=UPI000D72FF33|nr:MULTISPECIES: ABC transporter ATP-binding protein [Auritidibacter]NIH72623.1 ABC-2 type transport system ATP-binding protein [Auritidibacter ignavus]PXA80572.1 ABC transporter ATP-binding protein [Auritidibacter sp. NML120636]RMX23164.1 ABC transporter ATP-binding protein [Auritidibacter ignavus]WGH83178.1 ABC transporter ATP-binding protein [Auritidibacter ignavus]WGH85728.1 ABC transporter ATP-binding protein [Auritidibacter ignavus]